MSFSALLLQVTIPTQIIKYLVDFNLTYPQTTLQCETPLQSTRSCCELMESVRWLRFACDASLSTAGGKAGWQSPCSPAAISRMAITGCPPKVPMLGPRVTRTLATVGIDSASMGDNVSYGKYLIITSPTISMSWSTIQKSDKKCMI